MLNFKNIVFCENSYILPSTLSKNGPKYLDNWVERSIKSRYIPNISINTNNGLASIFNNKNACDGIYYPNITSIVPSSPSFSYSRSERFKLSNIEKGKIISLLLLLYNICDYSLYYSRSNTIK